MNIKQMTAQSDADSLLENSPIEGIIGSRLFSVFSLGVRVAPSTVRRTLRVKLLAGSAAVLAALSVGILAPAQSASAASFTTISGAGSTWAQNAISTWTADEA